MVRLPAPSLQRVRGDDGRDAAVLPDEGEPLLGPLRVHRHVDPAGPRDREQHGQPLHGPGQGDADPDLRAHAHRGQPPGGLRDPQVHLGVGQPLVTAEDGDPVGAPLGHAGAPQRAQGDRGLSGADAGHTPPLDQRLPLAPADQLHLAQRTARTLPGHGGGQLQPVPAHPLHRLPVEQVGAVLGDRQQPSVLLGEGEGQVGLGGVPDRGDGLRAQAGQVELGTRSVLEHDHRLDQRGPAGVALGGQLLDEAAERHVLVGEGVEDRRADPGEQLLEGDRLVDLGAQDERVDEEADQPFERRLLASRDTGAQRDVGAAAPAGQQELGEGGDHHEEAGAPVAAEGVQFACQLRRDLEGVLRPGRGAHRRAGPVGRQVQRFQTVQAVAPVGELAVEAGFREASALPDGVVRVLHGELGKGGVLAAYGRRVERAQFAGDDPHRPAVGDDVVHHQEQGVGVGLGGGDQQHAEQRTGAQVEGDGGLRAQERVQGLVGGGGGRADGDVHRGVHHLGALPVHRGEGGAQRLVPGDQARDGGGERGVVEGAGQAEGAGDVVLGGAGREVVQEPEAFLREGEREPALAGGRGQRLVGGRFALRGAAPCRGGGRRAVHGTGEVGQPGCLEEVAYGQLGTEAAADPADHPGGEQGVAAEREEIVLGADPFDAQHLGPDRGEGRLGTIARRHVRGGLGPHRGGQGATVQLAAGGHGQRVEGDEGGRDHVVGQAAPDRLAQVAAGGQGAALGRDQVRGDARGALGVLADGGGRVGDIGVVPQRGLDLAGLDAEAAHLDLVVGAAQVLQVAVGGPAHQVTRAEEAVAGAGRVGDEPLGGAAGPVGVAARQAGARHVQLARDAARDRVEAGVQDTDAGVPEGRADPHVRAVRLPGEAVGADLGGAVEVEQAGVGELRVETGGQRAAERFATADPGGAGGQRHGVGLVQEDRQEAGDQGQALDAVAPDQLGQGERVLGRLVRGEDDVAAVDEGAEEFGGAVEEADGALGADHRGPRPGVPVGEPRPAAQQPAVQAEDALGAAGGAGGVDDVGGVVGAERDVGGGGRQSGRALPDEVEVDDGARGGGGVRRVARPAEHGGDGAAGDGGAHAALGQHPGDALARERRVDGQIGPARLQHGEGGHHQVGGTRQADRDRVLPAHPGPHQVVRQLVGAGVESGVGQQLVAAGQRGRTGRAGDLLGEPAGDRALGRRRVVPATAVGEQPGQFGAGDRRGLVQPDAGVGGDRAGQRREVPPHPLHGGGVEERGAVLDRAVQGSTAGTGRRALLELPAHLVGGVGAGELAALHAQALEGAGLGRRVLQDHHRLDERRARGVAFRRDQLHQPLERHVLVLEGGQDGLPHLVEVGGEGEAGVQAGTEDEDVDEEADEGLHLGPLPARHRGAHRDVVLARAPGQQELGQRGQRDEEAGAALAAQGPQSVGHLLGEGEGVHGARVVGAAPFAARGGAGPVGRQLQRLDAGQLLLPVGRVAVEGVRGVAGALPGREVGVLHGERFGRVRRPLRVQAGRVPRAQLPDDDLHRGAVGDDVVHPQQEAVRAAGRPLRSVPGAGAYQQGADQRPALKVVRLRHRLGEEQVARRLGRLLTVLRHQVHVPERHRRGRVHHLPGHALHRGEGGPQRLVPGRDRVQRRAERGHVQRAGQSQAQPRVVPGRPLLVLRHEPQPLLGEGEGEGAVPVGAADGVPAAARPAPGEAVPEFLLHVFRQRTDPGLTRRRGVHGRLPFVRGKGGEKGARTPSTGRGLHPARRRPRT
ncbi:hypothetical protein EES47_07150 [Streptomyces sp. ADI98-12]|nr:hypothetical protein EES47_07150 [Streptomyces sp. ADI98-12]